jgi:biopolymer transport protein ExbD
MSKIKRKKHSTLIDMTAMSDVTVLLLTFFILTSNFIPKEPVQLSTPASVSEIKIPEANRMMILIDPSGKVYMNLDKPSDKLQVLEKIGKDFNIAFTDKQKKAFINQPNIGMPIATLQKFLDMDVPDQDKALKEYGIPADSSRNEFKIWVRMATDIHKAATGEDITIAIKSDKSTPYPKIKNVMTTLQDLKLNRYNLITTLEGMPQGF